MLRNTFVAILVAAFALSAHAEDGQPSVRITGSTSVANSLILPHQAEIEKAAGVKLIVTPNSSGAGVTDLAAKRADVAMISSNLDEITAKTATALQAYKVDKGQLRQFDLGEARVEFIVSESNPVRKLTAEQVKAIYLGKLTNWKDAGGSAADIEPFAESKHGAMRAILEQELLGGQAISSSVGEADEAPQVAAMVARFPQAIGFVSSTTPKALRQGTATLETDARLVQHLALVTQGEPSAAAARVIDAVKHLP